AEGPDVQRAHLAEALGGRPRAVVHRVRGQRVGAAGDEEGGGEDGGGRDSSVPCCHAGPPLSRGQSLAAHHSWRRALMGLRAAALRAGNMPETTPTTAQEKNAMATQMGGTATSLIQSTLPRRSRTIPCPIRTPM